MNFTEYSDVCFPPSAKTIWLQGAKYLSGFEKNSPRSGVGGVVGLGVEGADPPSD